MKKLIKNKICGSVNSTYVYCSWKTGQMLRLLFMYRTWTVAASGRKRVKKKKGKRSKLETQETQETRIQTHTQSLKANAKMKMNWLVPLNGLVYLVAQVNGLRGWYHQTVGHVNGLWNWICGPILNCSQMFV